MEAEQIARVRRFNRAVTQRVGALEESYLRRGRPLGEARLLFEIGEKGADVSALRLKLRLDSGYLSRLLRSLEAQGLIRMRTLPGDRRARFVVRTAKGRAEQLAYDRLSNDLAKSILAGLGAGERSRLIAAMTEVERLMRASAIETSIESPAGADARRCLRLYFQELARRFEDGFDASKTTSASAEEMTPPAGVFVVARLDGVAVGCGGLKRLDERTGEIKRMWTAPEARGMGVAGAVLHRLEEQARAMGLAVIRLDTNRVLKEAQALYRKLGYREIPRFNSNRYAHHWFEKRLPARKPA
jgi:DNA-binding MarR family transcriptional regulator/ribosomal protein S18 acetylase RimI-like enzyme